MFILYPDSYKQINRLYHFRVQFILDVHLFWCIISESNTNNEKIKKKKKINYEVTKENCNIKNLVLF